MPKPSDVKSTQKTPNRKPSKPVRNPAFREHEGLRALQQDLNKSHYGNTK